MVSYLSIRFVQQYFLLITGYVLATATTYAQTIRYVSPTGPNATPATAMSWANSTSDLQGAINASQPGDQVWVAAGTYKPGGNANTDRTISFSMKNGVAIYGGFTGTETALNQRPAINPVNGQPSSSTLSGEIGDPSSTSDNSYHVIMNTIELNNTAVLDGFVVTRGNGEGNFPNSAGGGVYNYASGNGSYCSPTFLNCSFIKNSSSFAGGAIYNDGNNSGNCSPVLTNCFFTDNSASVGGAIYTRGADSGISSPVLTNCLFRSNIATSQGGAIFNRGSSAGTNNYVLTNCSFQSNSAVNAGGAVYNTTESSGIGNPILTNCSFQSNSTSYVGGAIYNNTYNSDSAPVLSNCAFQNNTAQWAGGIFTYSYSGNNNSVLTNCSFLNNSARWGGGIYNWGDAGNCSSSLINCSFQGNSATGTGGAMINQTSSNSIINLQLANCILFGNGGESTFGPYYTGTTISATYSIFESAAVSGASQINLTGMGNLLNITTSPFTSTSSVALATCSPAINAGNPVSITALSEPYSATALPTTDLIGSPRIFGGRVDMGAVEYQHHPQCPTRLYVNAGASGSNTGLDWKNAFTNLQDALSYTNSLSLTEIWVAAGVYKPTSTTARDISFSMKNGVTIYGGFVGTA